MKSFSKKIAHTGTRKGLIGEEEVRESIKDMIDNFIPILVICAPKEKGDTRGVKYAASFLKEIDLKQINQIIQDAASRINITN